MRFKPARPISRTPTRYSPPAPGMRAKFKLSNWLPLKRLNATTAARRLRDDGGDDLDSESNMKLSSAFIVVLVLHLVAIGGIYAYTAIKANRAPATDRAFKPAPVKPAHAAPAPPAIDNPEPLPATNAAPVSAKPKPPEIAHKPVEKVAPEPRKPTTAASLKPAMTRDSGDTYVVAKGDNPVAIARKLGVSYDELIKINKIDDPKKLQIGTRLRVPAKKPATP